MLYHISYISTQSREMTASDLKDILEEARTSNEANDITGLLLHRDDAFLQVLEGDKESVLETFVRIEKDPRHKEVQVLFSKPIDEREFEDWSMAFTNLDNVKINELPGFSDFLLDDSKPREFLEDLSRTKRTILLFRSMH